MRARFWLVAVGCALLAGPIGCGKKDTAPEGAASAGAAPAAASAAAEQGATADKQGALEKAPAEAANSAPAGQPAAEAGSGAAAGEPVAPVEGQGGAEAAPAAGEAAGEQAAAAEAGPPPTAADIEAEKARVAQEERQQKLQAIYELGRKRDEASLTELKNIMSGDQEPGIRATAIRVLGRENIESMVPTLKDLTKSSDLPVKMEAAIVLYQWGERKFAEPLLDELSTQGVALRRAFLTGRKDGKNEYDPAAKRFLKKGLESDNVYTRLDAALGLYEMGDDKTSLSVFNDVMQKEETFYVRMAALNYLRHLKDDPKINKVITSATEDKDERVRERAKQILAEPSTNE